MPALEIKLLDDKSAIDALYADPYIARVGHDHRPAARIEHPLASYLGAYIDGALSGAFLALRVTALEVDLHSLLRRSALKHSRTLGLMCIKAVFADPLVMRATAYVIQGLEAARNYCLKLGFKDEGFRRDACQYRGELVGVHIMGITRREFA